MSTSGRSGVTPAQLAINVLTAPYNAKGNGAAGDGTAVNKAIVAANARATAGQFVDVVLPSGYEFQLEQITALPGVRLVCDGACVIPNWGSIGDHPLITYASGLNRWGVRGGTWQGSGAETVNEFIFEGPLNATGQDWLFRDMHVTNWATAPLYLRNVGRCRVIDNDFLNVNNGPFGTFYNVVDWVGDAGAAQILQYLLARGNTITGTLGEGIAVVTAQPGTVDLKALIEGNTIATGAAGPGIQGSCIDFESADNTGAVYTGFTVIGNDCQFNGFDGAPNAAINVSPTNTPGTQLKQYLIEGNRVVSNHFGIRTFCGDGIIANNRIAASSLANSIALGGGVTPDVHGNILAGGPVSGTAVMVAGTVTVNTPEIRAGDNVLLSIVSHGGGAGEVTLGVITPGVSFTIVNSNNTSTDTVYWRIDH